MIAVITGKGRWRAKDTSEKDLQSSRWNVMKANTCTVAKETNRAIIFDRIS